MHFTVQAKSNKNIICVKEKETDRNKPQFIGGKLNSLESVSPIWIDSLSVAPLPLPLPELGGNLVIIDPVILLTTRGIE